MGLNLLCSNSTYDEKKRKPKKVNKKALIIKKKIIIKNLNPNPNPKNYKVLRHEQIGVFLLLKIIYPDCTNYEGEKILVYKDVTIEDLRKQKIIDPHFCDNKKYHSPIIRLEPTPAGWHMARRMALMETERKDILDSM